MLFGLTERGRYDYCLEVGGTYVRIDWRQLQQEYYRAGACCCSYVDYVSTMLRKHHAAVMKAKDVWMAIFTDFEINLEIHENPTGKRKMNATLQDRRYVR